LVSGNTSPAGGPIFTIPQGIAIEQDGKLVVADDAGFGPNPSVVIRVNPSNGVRTTVSSNTAPAGGPSLSRPTGIAVESSGDLVVADWNAFGGSGGVIRINPRTGARSTVSSNTSPAGGPSFADPTGIAVGPNGSIYVTEPGFPGIGNGFVMRVDPVTGARRFVSSGTSPVGGAAFHYPDGIAFEGSGSQKFLVTNDVEPPPAGGNNLIRVIRTSGVRSLVSSNSSPAGGASFTNPSGVAMAGNDALVADFNAFGGSGGVIKVDPATGARVSLSHNGAPAGGPSFSSPSELAVKTLILTLVTRSLGTVKPPDGGIEMDFRLSAPARVKFTIDRVLRGRVVDGECRAGTPAAGSSSCTLYQSAGSFSRTGRKGSNRALFNGKLGTKTLAAGNYRATLQAVAGQYESPPTSALFSVVR
jgi:hypothetical protein